MAVGTLSQKVKKELKALVVEVVAEAMGDPDRGLELSARAKRRLRRARITRGKTTSFSEIIRKYS